MGSAAELFVGQIGEETLDLIDPGGALGREMQVEARMSEQPALDERCLVSSVVVEDEMGFQFLGDVLVDRLEKLPKLDAAVASVMLRDDLAALDVERREKRSGAVTDVIVSSALNLSGPQRQDGLRTIQGLDLRFLVHAEDHGTIWRIQVKADDIPDLLNQQRIGRDL